MEKFTLNKALHYKSNQQWNRVIKETNKGYKKNIYEIDRSAPLDWHLGLAYFNTNDIEKSI